MAMTQEQYEKIQQYLISNGQQELLGHLDGIWQELNQLRSEAQTNASPNAQQFQDDAKQVPDVPETNEWGNRTDGEQHPVPDQQNPSADDGVASQGAEAGTADTTLTEGETPAETEKPDEKSAS